MILPEGALSRLGKAADHCKKHRHVPKLPRAKKPLVVVEEKWIGVVDATSNRQRWIYGLGRVPSFDGWREGKLERRESWGDRGWGWKGLS